MKKFLQFAATVASALLLSACSTNALYKNVKTEETFRMIKDTNPQDLGIKSVSYSYKVTGNKKIDAMAISMMAGDMLRITYSKGGKPQFIYIMNKDKSCRINAADKKAEALSPAAAATLKFFYDINFKDPAKAAQYITLRNVKPVAEGKGKAKKEYFIFDIEPKEIYGLEKIVLKVNAKTRFVEAIDFEYPENEQDIVISNTYKDIAIKSGLTVAQVIESSFLGTKATYKLSSFAVNRSVKASDFKVPEIKVPAEVKKVEKKVEKKAEKKAVKKTEKSTKKAK